MEIKATLILLIFFGYASYIAYRYGVLKSISSSTYELPGLEKYIFWVVLTTVAIINLFMGMDTWGFWASAGMMFTGITVNYRQNIESKVHNFGVVGAILVHFTGMIVMHGIWLPALLVFLTLLGMKFTIKNNLIWYGELVIMFYVWLSYMMLY